MQTPRLLWDLATAYDLFISLHVLHRPQKFELRGAWAAGVRSRLPAADREFLEQTADMLFAPVHWVHFLPEPKDGAAVLRELAALPSDRRLGALTLSADMPPPVVEILEEVAARGRWDDADLQAIAAATHKSFGHLRKDMAIAMDWWSRVAEFGERLLPALRAYHEVFFAEEERRIRPALQAALGRAQEMAAYLPLTELLEELSQGIRYSELPATPELALAPSFWATPLIIQSQVSEKRKLLLFGARPATASLVPGEVIPDALYRVLKSLADPTRLRILRYLATEPMTPVELSRRLRLRPPTVSHHLHTLRLAGLIYLTLAEGDRRYAARLQTMENTFAALQGFVQQKEE